MSFVFVSCQKEIPLNNFGDITPGGGGNSILGTWIFAGATVSSYSEATANDGGSINKSVSKIDYSTKNNTGTYTFTADKINSNGVSYLIDTTGIVYYYTNGVFEDSLDIPFTFPVSLDSTSSDYKLVGTDSFYVSGASFSINTGTGTTAVNSLPSGGKYNISGNTLILSFATTRDTTITDSGTGVAIKQRVNATIKLVK